MSGELTELTRLTNVTALEKKRKQLMSHLRRYMPEPLINEWLHASFRVVICLLSLVTTVHDFRRQTLLLSFSNALLAL